AHPAMEAGERPRECRAGERIAVRGTRGAPHRRSPAVAVHAEDRGRDRGPARAAVAVSGAVAGRRALGPPGARAQGHGRPAALPAPGAREALIDAHAHLTDAKFAGEVDGMLARARDAGITRILTCGEDVASSRAA